MIGFLESMIDFLESDKGVRYPLCFEVTSDGQVCLDLWWFRVWASGTDDETCSLAPTRFFMVFYGYNQVISLW